MRVAVFGKPGGGKSTLAARVAHATGLPLVQIDLLRYEDGGAEVAAETFMARYVEVLARPNWVLDGFASPATFQATLDQATVLVYVERPALVHYWWVTKRFILSPLRAPLGWPRHSPMLASTLASYRYLRRSPRFWTDELKERLRAHRPAKRVHFIGTASDEKQLLDDLQALAQRP